MRLVVDASREKVAMMEPGRLPRIAGRGDRCAEDEEAAD